MSTTPGRTTHDIAKYLRQQLEGADLDGPILEGAAQPQIQVKLTRAEDDNDVGKGAYTNLLGGFLIKHKGSRTIDVMSASESGTNPPDTPADLSRLQWRFAHNFDFEFSYGVAGVTGERLTDSTLWIQGRGFDRLSAALSPNRRAPQLDVQTFRMDAPVRHKDNKDIYIQVIGFTLFEYWRTM